MTTAAAPGSGTPKILKRFGVVKLWPEVHTAEDENLARIRETAQSLGLECVAVDSFGRLAEAPFTQMGKDDLDFIIYLHFEIPKACDIFSFVALWNPLSFFYDWGYRRFTSHLITHDDFLSCSSTWADDHVRRLVANDPTRLPPSLTMYHSLSSPILAPTVGDRKLFYVGVNWERVGKQRGRHQELLEMLDKTGDLRIYGPKIFHGIDVWEGFQSYAGPIPFDGTSIVHEIHRCGASLALSSEAHIQSELMSNRLFESLAAGAVVICDENPFARRFFGNTLLYVDASLPADEVFAQVNAHLDWIEKNPNQAKELAGSSQDIFRERFALDHSLSLLYERFASRRTELEAAYLPARPDQQISVVLLAPEFHAESFARRIDNVRGQRSVNVHCTLAVDPSDLDTVEAWVRQNVGNHEQMPALMPVDWFVRHSNGTKKRMRRRGAILWDIIQQCEEDAIICMAAPNELLYENHLSILLHNLQENDTAEAACSDILWRHKAEGTEFLDVQNRLEIGEWRDSKPIGYARFLFLKSALPESLGFSLPYLDRLAMNLLAGAVRSCPGRRATMQIDIQHDFNTDSPDPTTSEEKDILVDCLPRLFGPLFENSADELEPARLSLHRLSPENKTYIAAELAHSVPVPAVLKRAALAVYRRYLSWSGR